MKWRLIFLVFLLFPIISATCEEGQIDINLASLGELDVLSGIGPAYAQRIIDARPFNSVDELVKVSGIAEITLGKIKAQGLACVEGENEIEEESKVEEVFEEEKEVVIEEVIKEEKIVEEINEPKNLEMIELNPKVIKTDNSEESYNVYAIWGLVTFSILLVLLFMLSKLKVDKNEFDR